MFASSKCHSWLLPALHAWSNCLSSHWHPFDLQLVASSLRMVRVSFEECYTQYIWAKYFTFQNRALGLSCRTSYFSSIPPALRIRFCLAHECLTGFGLRYLTSQMILSFPLFMLLAHCLIIMSRTGSGIRTTFYVFFPWQNQSPLWYHHRREEARRPHFWTEEYSKASRRGNSSSMLHP